ncbi:MAG: M23 family metallopeptidase [Bacilli bacterium]|jgi:murein DD-endopeptidase MepM/ murein hydrolase activator NlpD
MKFNPKDFLSAKGLTKKVKQKIILQVAVFLSPFILKIAIIFMAVLIIMAPIITFTNHLDSFKSKVSTFFARGWNLITFNGFYTTEERFYKDIEDHYILYLEKGVEVDIPLVLSTLHYPHQVDYDAEKYNKLMEDSDILVDPDDEESKEVYKTKTKIIKDLMRNMVYIEESIHDCECTETDEDGSCVSYRVIYPPISRKEWEDKIYRKKDFPKNSPCPNYINYSYRIDYVKYNKYLKEEYIPSTEEFNLPKDLDEKEMDRLIDAIIMDINQRASFFNAGFLDKKLMDYAWREGVVHGQLSDYGLLEYLAIPFESDYSITSCFGPRLLSWENEVRTHKGIDVVARDSKNILAAADGYVNIVQHGNESYGNWIEIVHGLDGENSYATRYAHLSSIKVVQGEVVKMGDVIGVEGSTGNSSGSHLHFEVRINGKAINPGDLFSNPIYIATDDPNCKQW